MTLRGSNAMAEPDGSTMRVLSASLTFLLLLGCTSTQEGSRGLAAQAKAECEREGLAPGSWAFQYCTVRTAYLGLVAAGNVSDAGTITAVTIEDQRNRCLERAEVYKEVSDAEMQELHAKLRAEALPRLIAKHGEAEGTKEFNRRLKMVLEALEAAEAADRSERREECNKQAVDAYRTWMPVLIR